MKTHIFVVESSIRSLQYCLWGTCYNYNIYANEQFESRSRIKNITKSMLSNKKLWHDICYYDGLIINPQDCGVRLRLIEIHRLIFERECGKEREKEFKKKDCTTNNNH